MGRKLNLILVEKILREKGFWVFTPWEFAQIFKTSLVSSQKFLERYTKKGVFLRAKKGLYLFQPSPEREIILANKIYFPSYVSLETALSYYNLIPETVYAVTSVTTKPTREFEVEGRLFEYRKIKKEAFTGYVPKQINGETGLMATAEKAMVDYLYFVSLGKKNLNERINFRGIDFSKIKDYSKLYENLKLERIINDVIAGNRKNR